MCVVSMIYDHYQDKWKQPPYYVPNPPPVFVPTGLPTQAEIDDFRKLLERAREYDKKHNQPDCELEEKRQKIKDLAKELGVEVNFV
jgi:hypothetical protein